MRTGRNAYSRAGAFCAIYFNNFHVPELLISFDRSLSSDCPRIRLDIKKNTEALCCVACSRGLHINSKAALDVSLNYRITKYLDGILKVALANINFAFSGIISHLCSSRGDSRLLWRVLSFDDAAS